MIGDQILRTEEEVDFLRAERVLFCLEIDAVENQVEVVAVGFDFGMVNLCECVFDGQLVEVEDLGQDLRLLWSGCAQIHPHPDSAVGFEPGWVHLFHRSSGLLLVFVDRDQSPTLIWSAACAAARRATGTRYGEQLT